jgi:hypothetical protein
MRPVLIQRASPALRRLVEDRADSASISEATRDALTRAETLAQRLRASQEARGDAVEAARRRLAAGELDAAAVRGEVARRILDGE